VACFCTRNSGGGSTTSATHLTTFSPQKHHTKNALFLKHPQKTPAKTKKTPDRTGVNFFPKKVPLTASIS
jgi:hypothetical protein